MTCAIIITEGVYNKFKKPRGPVFEKSKYNIRPTKTGGKAIIELKNIIDSKIKGGFILKVGDLQFNASIAERMETLKRELITSKKNS